MAQEHHAIDVHQHLWTDELVDRLRARTSVPYLRGWTLHTAAEPPYEVDPESHDVARRLAADTESEVGLTCLSLSAPLGIEALPRPQASLLIDAWHRGVSTLPEHFKAWASVPSIDPDLAAVRTILAHERFAGLQLPATEVDSPAAWERNAGLLLAAEQAGKPVFVHPGAEPRRPLRGTVPGWWDPVVGYVAQQQAAWWGWHAFDGRSLFPDLRIVFAAGAGLAPVHAERHLIRGGRSAPVDPNVFVDTSCYGPRALDSLVRHLGIDALVLGSDRPYGEPIAELFGDAATHAVRVANPQRLLEPRPRGGELEWAIAS
ncbi:MAG: amidohydrolase [Nocardioidaceae bacterium]|nr:amidohydrolase [Nocardioidaceae bacterium]